MNEEWWKDPEQYIPLVAGSKNVLEKLSNSFDLGKFRNSELYIYYTNNYHNLRVKKSAWNTLDTLSQSNIKGYCHGFVDGWYR